MVSYVDFLKTAKNSEVEAMFAAMDAPDGRIPENTWRPTRARLYRAGVIDADGRLAPEFLRHRGRDYRMDWRVARLPENPRRVLVALLAGGQWTIADLADSLHMASNATGNAVWHLIDRGLAAYDETNLTFHATAAARAAAEVVDVSGGVA
jgi:hypothetical protein